MVLTRRHLLSAATLAPFASAMAQDPDGTPRILLGPMAGAATSTAISVWVMMSGALPIRLEVSKAADFSQSMVSEEHIPAGRLNHCCVLTIGGLAPDTPYYYRLRVDGEPDKYQSAKLPPKTKTAPRIGTETPFRFAFGSCARIQRDPVQPIWRSLANAAPDLFLWLGDNIYADTLDRRVMALEYQRQRGVAAFHRFGAEVPQLAIWDDHDFGLNNHDRTNPIKTMALDAFRQYWANPSYGLPDTTGVFFKHTYGATDFFCLDGRMYRDPNAATDEPDKTLLGKDQLSWLKTSLKESKAVFKILACGSGWTKAKGTGGDSWASFLHERNALFDFIRDERIDGVVLISGDTHCAELNCIPWSSQGGYDFYDLVSSPLAQNATLSWMNRAPEKRIRTPYSGSANAGLVTIEFNPEPRLRYEVITSDGQSPMAPLTLRLSELTNGVTSWPTHQSPELN